MRRYLAILIASLMGVSLVACGNKKYSAPVNDEKYFVAIKFSNQDKEEVFGERLDSSRIAYSIEKSPEGNRFFRWSYSDSDKVQSIHDDLFGKVPASGRSVSFNDELQSEFKGWLKENSLAFEVIFYDGHEYVVWEKNINNKVRKFQHFR